MVFWLQRLKYPLLLWIADMLLYRLLGGAEIECGRCPVPPMTDWQHFLPTMGTVAAWVAVIWAYLMIESEKNGRY
ncbi:TPA: hypothetical protein WI164_000759 [Neisseria meningitidis]|uniref:hypothetical protein n=2 Tax=Neisseria meningitidis TaxID=487 RepID=UPI0015D55324|nr:hypothetical protein [Neisseria meningitidis]MBH2276704.1 hypothetical protein [Neisseria meningitidis]MBH2379971.1 hypothetical protein [Neisseria meningitidis]MBH2386749.1 hypothetical protein [Neisseria meningitidis]MBH2389713.1 hypothetical protein [Neisseria meningitidis]MBH5879219.1 hypothetical protein [Neisseria meningitidis]